MTGKEEVDAAFWEEVDALAAPVMVVDTLLEPEPEKSDIKVRIWAIGIACERCGKQVAIEGYRRYIVQRAVCSDCVRTGEKTMYTIGRRERRVIEREIAKAAKKASA